MTVDEEILLEHALSERRYILNVAHDRIASLGSDESENDGDFYAEYDEGYVVARGEALAIIVRLLNNPNV
jgi:hypothetical protein